MKKMNKNLLEQYKDLLEDDTLNLFDDEEKRYNFYDFKNKKIGVAYFKDIYGTEEVKWGNRIIIPDDGRFKGSFKIYNGNKHYYIYDVINTTDKVIFYGNYNKIYGGIHFERCLKLTGYETRIKKL